MQDKNNKNPLRLMHDVSCESLMLWLSENPQASLDSFRELTLQDYPAGQGFIRVYRLAIDARTLRGDGVGG